MTWLMQSMTKSGVVVTNDLTYVIDDKMWRCCDKWLCNQWQNVALLWQITWLMQSITKWDVVVTNGLTYVIDEKVWPCCGKWLGVCKQ